MSKCSVGVNIKLKNGELIIHKYYAADQLKDFVLSCDINDVMKAELKKLRSVAIDNWVIKNKDRILPQAYAAQRDNTKGKKQPPRMMSYAKYWED